MGEWYAMPLAREDLSVLFARGHAPWQALRAGLPAVADVVAKAHQLGLVHRDLSDANVLVYPDRWCVGDWGFVYNRHVERQTRQTRPCGSPQAPDACTRHGCSNTTATAPDAGARDDHRVQPTMSGEPGRSKA